VEWLIDLFETNRIIVLSVYGQVFFVLGLAIALQSRKRSTLPLARPLPWLAAFGIVHAFVEWGYLFVPIQSGFLPSPLIQLLLVAQLGLKGLSFALLLQFGAELLLSFPRPDRGTPRPGPLGQPWLRMGPAAALVLWAFGTLALSLQAGPFSLPANLPWLEEGAIRANLEAVGAPLFIGDVLARYMLALPGAVVVMIGLRRTAAALDPVARPPVGFALRVAAVAFALYAVLGGLIGMPAPIPPANVLNAETVLASIGIPIEVLRSAAGLLIAIAVVRSLDLFEQETDRALAEARRRELLLRERERIGRDLHDGIIQSIYAVGLHLEEASTTIGPEADGAAKRIETVLEELNRITGDIRAYIFDLRSATLDSLEADEIVAGVAEELRANTLVNLDLRVEGEHRPNLTAEQAEQLRHIAQEAFSNVLRHARAQRVAVRLHCGRRELTLEIRDDGVGFDAQRTAPLGRDAAAQGLENMRRRAELVDARLSVKSQPGQGTALWLTMPVQSSRPAARRPAVD
jgi:signal transduction histidine kinase